MTCTCTQHSPFLWAQHPRPSIFATDTAFKSKPNSDKTSSQSATDVVIRKRKENINHGTLYGLTKDREEAMTRAKYFHMYSKAGVK
jgi:hypothetical protein